MSEGSAALHASTTQTEEPLAEPERRLYCIAGLGNPGSRYEATPHNLGFRVLDELAKRHGIRISSHERGILSGMGTIRNRNVLLIKPQTFMNNSGTAIRAALKFRKLTNRDLIVVYDELDLPWTAVRIKKNGSAAGHNGVRSIIAALDTDFFTRVRVGIRPSYPLDNATGYVLAPLGPDMRPDLDEVVPYTADAIESIIAEGAIKAMAKFNRRARGIQQEEE